MQKNIDIKNRIVEFYDVDMFDIEDDIVSYLDRKMKVRIYSATIGSNKYVFTGNPKDHAANSITISGYRTKQPGEKTSIDISVNY